MAREQPEFDRYGIHVMASQNGRGELVIGDSHEYDERIEPFDKPEIDRLILDYLDTFLAAPDLRIAARWHGIYARHPRDAYFVARPAPGVTMVDGRGRSRHDTVVWRGRQSRAREPVVSPEEACT